ncbi:triple tyrosine motif-containing protein [Olleya sp. YS]|uniref:helix-turn-helix and ligand-binding sensor domain-containing protein n=1 Tax=Olleya sp. YS TaxID=3028318 RepID=UPI002434555A|nr:triple tyrosine motif-containing protein [Olleya sp. YS]WGD34246.1 triple tyrosine motif-containing protein [Olleya sp. YS]
MLNTKLTYWLKLSKTLFIIGFCMNIQALLAQDLPPIQYYSPKQYNAENQNWAISQSNNKYIYVANSKGLLEFNGAGWTLYPSPNQTIVRSVKVVDDKIYTGSYMEFGYWSKTNIGDLKYTSLSEKIRESLLEDEQFWNITSLDDWLLFQSLNRIYIYNFKTDSFKIIDSERGITKMFKVDNTIYYQDINKGLLKLENGESKTIIDASVVSDKIIVGVYLLNYKLQIVTQEHGIFSLDNNGLQEWSKKINTKLVNYSVYSSRQLKDGSLLLGTISNGMLQISTNAEIIQKISQADGLGNNTVLSVFEDIENNIWLALDNGINCININSPFKIFNDDNGMLGTVYTSVIFDNILYLGTNQGLFYKHENESTFKAVNGIKGQVWKLKIINDILFCGHNSGTFTIKDNIATQIANIDGTWDLLPIKNNPNLLLQGNYNGLNVLENSNGSWKFRNKIEGFDNSSRFFVFSSDNEILVNHEYKGVFKIQVDTDLRRALKVSKIEGLEKGLFSSLTEYNDEIYYATEQGIFKKLKQEQTFVKDSILSELFVSQGYSSGKLITNKSTNTLWIVTQKGINYISPGKLSKIPNITFIALPNSLREGLSGYESVFNLKPNVYLFGTSKGYIVLDVSKIIPKSYDVYINSLNKSPLQTKTSLVNLQEVQTLTNKENNLAFTYSVAEYDKYLEAEYSHKLEGLYNNWSSWSTEANVLYKNLPHGDYTFRVKARVGGENLKDEAIYSFSIAKPWYLSNIMVAIYFLAACIALLLINYFYKLYYRKQKEKLVQKSNRELEMKDLETKQQLMALNNDKLRQEIESKNRELAISTMSLIKKNEFLNTIKSELNDKVKDTNLKSVIKIIDKNINNKDDWNLFEEAFNNADKDFLKKVKSKHPSLTSNDLRLCAYLRLNLSSKEIAPLLNISPRSVEVKRYRLRKKMELAHDVNLTDYILSI